MACVGGTGLSTIRAQTIDITDRRAAGGEVRLTMGNMNSKLVASEFTPGDGARPFAANQPLTAAK
jgi:hypothetical protein